MKKTNLVCMIFLLLSLNAVIALTASIGNVRMVLYPSVYPGETTVINKTIKVNNYNPGPVFVELSTQGNFSQMIRILDSNFTLQPNETKDARFEVILKEPGRYDGKIYVSFNPDGENVNESGVGLASNIIIFAKNSTKPEEPVKKEERSLAVPIIVLCLMIIVGVGVYHVRSKK